MKTGMFFDELGKIALLFENPKSLGKILEKLYKDGPDAVFQKDSIFTDALHLCIRYHFGETSLKEEEENYFHQLVTVTDHFVTENKINGGFKEIVLGYLEYIETRSRLYGSAIEIPYRSPAPLISMMEDAEALWMKYSTGDGLPQNLISDAVSFTKQWADYGAFASEISTRLFSEYTRNRKISDAA